MDSIESISNAKRKAAELADTTLSLINSKELSTAGSYYLKALEEVGRIRILQNDLGAELTKTQESIVENAGNTQQEARNFRIQAALAYLGRENEVSCVVKNGTQFVVRKDVPMNELKRVVVSLKTKLAFL
jgi:CRISPR/Cas system-associated exonuclease Cas4 (RecB family)